VLTSSAVFLRKNGEIRSSRRGTTLRDFGMTLKSALFPLYLKNFGMTQELLRSDFNRNAFCFAKSFLHLRHRRNIIGRKPTSFAEGNIITA
jgi:hypothetical protein